MKFFTSLGGFALLPAVLDRSLGYGAKFAVDLAPRRLLEDFLATELLA